MNAFQTIRKIFLNACVYNTVFILAIYSAALLLPNGSGLIPKLEYMFMILLFSIFLSASNLLLYSKRFNAVIRTMIHYLCVAVIFYVVFIVWGGFAKNGSMTLVVMLAFSAVYFIIVAVYSIIKKFTKMNPSEKENYETQFSSSSDPGGRV